jgi:hypothetical protein
MAVKKRNTKQQISNFFQDLSIGPETTGEEIAQKIFDFFKDGDIQDFTKWVDNLVKTYKGSLSFNRMLFTVCYQFNEKQRADKFLVMIGSDPEAGQSERAMLMRYYFYNGNYKKIFDLEKNLKNRNQPMSILELRYFQDAYFMDEQYDRALELSEMIVQSPEATFEDKIGLYRDYQVGKNDYTKSTEILKEALQFPNLTPVQKKIAQELLSDMKHWINEGERV